MKGFRALSVATAVATYALVVLGGVVRVSGSGLGCPDWPLCHGRVLPPLDLHAIIEYSHRTAGSVTGLLIGLTVVFAWIGWRQRRDIVSPATLAAGLLALEVSLGAITVRLELPPVIVLAHLATAMAILGTVCVTAVAAAVPRTTAPVDRGECIHSGAERFVGRCHGRQRRLRCLAALRWGIQPVIRWVALGPAAAPRHRWCDGTADYCQSALGARAPPP